MGASQGLATVTARSHLFGDTTVSALGASSQNEPRAHPSRPADCASRMIRRGPLPFSVAGAYPVWRKFELNSGSSVYLARQKDFIIRKIEG